MRTYVFGYGSLINAASLGRALKREVSQGQLIPALIHGYRRAFLLKEQVYSHELRREITALFLDLVEDEAGRVNGVFVEVSPSERKALARREKNYDEQRILGTPELLASGSLAGPCELVTFIGKDSKRLGEGDYEAFVMEEYVSILESGCHAIGKDFFELFMATTEVHGRPVLRGAYRFLDVVQAEHV